VTGRRRLGALAERDFRLFFTGYATSLVGAAMVPVALTFAVLQQGRSAEDVGYVLAAETVPLVILLLAGGVIADRLSRRAVMIGSDVARCASELLLAALLLTGSPALWVFMVLAGVIGAGQAFFNPALTGLLPFAVSACAWPGCACPPRLRPRASRSRPSCGRAGPSSGPGPGCG
jgi:MFS family permease